MAYESPSCGSLARYVKRPPTGEEQNYPTIEEKQGSTYIYVQKLNLLTHMRVYIHVHVHTNAIYIHVQVVDLIVDTSSIFKNENKNCTSNV